MLIMNGLMRDYINSLDLISKDIPEDLRSLLADGIVEKENCFFISRLLDKAGKFDIDKFYDRTGCECFVNSFHVSDYVDDDFFYCAVAFLIECFDIFNAAGIDGVLNAVISINNLDVVFKAHLIRDGEEWLNNDLDTYSEPILSVTSDLGFTLLGKEFIPIVF